MIVPKYTIPPFLLMGEGCQILLLALMWQRVITLAFPMNHLSYLLSLLGPLYTSGQGRKNLGPTLSIFGLLFGAKLLLNVRTLRSGYQQMLEHWPQGLACIGFRNSTVSFFSALGPIQGHKVQHLLVTWGSRLKRFFSISALTPCVKPLVLISTFGMLDLS